jgi:hypothetical protein
MNERRITVPFNYGGTLSANQTFYLEFKYNWTLLGAHAVASNDSSATLAFAGGATIAATAIGDSGDPTYITPASKQMIAADTLVTGTLDYDGAGGTAAQNVTILVDILVGEEA